MEQDYEAVLAQRTLLANRLRQDGVSGVMGIAVTNLDGHPALLVLVKPGFNGRIPERFEGTAVVVSETGSASFHSEPPNSEPPK
jgi:hypothetical protein